MKQKVKVSEDAGLAAVSIKNKNKNAFFVVDDRNSFSYDQTIKYRQILRAPMERWGMLELIKKSGIELSQREKENILIFGDIRGWEWAKYEKEKLSYEFDGGN